MATKVDARRGEARPPAHHPILRRLPLALPLLAFALYTFRLDAQSLWYDEAVSARLASMPLPDLIRWTADDIQPPLYYLLLHGWTRLVGTSEWALRYLSAWWGVLIVALGYTLARRLSRSHLAGLVAAFLFLLAPWNVYYSQETRMYTLLVALGVAWACEAVRPHPARSSWATGLRLGLLGLALLYTHYFSLFLLAALTLGGLLHAWRRHRSLPGVLKSFLLAWVTMFIGYLPWLPFLLRRFRVDASYWGGTLKLGEALRHGWVHMTLGAPETFLEQDAVRWAPFFLALTLLALLLHLRGRTARHAPSLPLLLPWLLLPPALILFLAYRTPKFNPRYLMVAYPAWVLLLATAPASLPPARGGLRRAFWAVPVLVLPLFARADLAWFTDPAFTKPDFRGAIAYIREHRLPDEPLLLVSGHMSPVVDYYAPGIPYLRLPDIEVLDVNQVLGFEVAAAINQAIAGAPGAWLLLWQDEVVDPMGIVPYLLGRAGAEDPAVPDAFWHVRVRHFRLPPDARVPESPPITHPLRANWANTVELLGYAQEADDTLALFFRPLRKVDEDLRLHLEVWDEQGFLWGQADARPGPYLYPTFRWQPGKVVLGRHPFPAVPGTPAGTYTLRLRLYTPREPSGLDLLDEAGNPAGKDAVLPRVTLSATQPATEALAFPPLPPQVQAQDVITLSLELPARAQAPAPVAVRLWPAPPWEPGQRVFAQVRWRAPRPPTPEDRFAVILWREGATHILAQGELARRASPSAAAWPPDAAFFSQVAGRVPRDVSPGPWTLAIRYASRRSDVVTVHLVREVEIVPSRRNFTLPSVVYPVDALFGGSLRLVGVDVSTGMVQPGATLPITVTWQSVQEVDRSYTAFVHVLGPDGRILGQEDHIPGRGASPTDTWIAGEVVQDRFDIVLPAELPPGPLVLEIGLYDALAPGYPRLPVTQGADQGGDVVRIPLARE